MQIAEWLSLHRAVAVAHRGGSALRPENTLVAFDHGLALGADAIECDVHLSRDGEVVVIHDPTLDRTTDARGPVAGLTADQLARVDAGYRFGASSGHPYRGQGIGVPRLEAVLARYRDSPVIVEVKGDRPEVGERAVEVIRRAGAVGRVVVGGFNRAVLEVVRRLEPQLATSAARDEAAPAVRGPSSWTAPTPAPFKLFQVPYRLHGLRQFDRAFVDAARRAGFPVQAWIVDKAADMRRLLSWGVTGIISDRPDVAVAEVRAARRSE